MPGIYKISSIRKPTRFYIGSAINPAKRWNRHLNDLRQNRHCNFFLQAHFNAWSESDFLFEIITVCETSELIEKEQYYLDHLKPQMNLCHTAGSRYQFPQSAATRLKISQSWQYRPPISMESRLKKPR